MVSINQESAVYGRTPGLCTSRAFLLLFLACSILFGTAVRSVAGERPSNERVLVVYNPDVPASKRIARNYIRKRNILPRNICAIKPDRLPAAETTVSVPYADLNEVVMEPVRTCLKKIGRDSVLYIVLTFGMPYLVSGVPKGEGTALDQRLVDVWHSVSNGHPVQNPYYAASQPKLGIYPPFMSLAAYRLQKDAKPIYSVWRLDGATAAIADGLVDKALTAEKAGALRGQACIDRRYGPDLPKQEDSGYYLGDWALYRAAEFLRDAGVSVLEDSNGAEFGTAPAPLRCDHAVFYAGWYSLDHYNDVFSWEPGAIGIHLDSASATNPRGGKNWSANALLRGLTVTSGAVDEPLLQGLPRVDGIVADLLAGATVGDAFLRNTPVVNWMIINLGDPLYRPPLRRMHFISVHPH